MTLSNVPIGLRQEVPSSSNGEMQLTTTLRSEGGIEGVDAPPISGTTHSKEETSSDQELSMTTTQVREDLAELDAQISACFDKCKFDQALGYADRMMDLADTSGHGYLRACQIYAAQGKPTQVLSVSASALEKIPEQDLLCRAAIEELRQEAEVRLERRVDFICQLPADVIPSILESWDIRDAIRISSVSRCWRERISQNPFLNLGVHFWRVDNSDLDILSRWSDKIRSIAFNVPCDKMNVIWRSIAAGHFSNLREIYSFNAQDDVNEGFKEALTHLGNTLEQLSIISGGNSTFRLNSILPYLGRKLKVLVYMLGKEDLCMPPVTLPDLDLMSLTLSSAHISAAYCEAIIRRCCRNAVKIAIDQCDHQVLSLIDELCPKVQYLSANGHLPYLTLQELTKLKDDAASGLKCVSGREMTYEQAIAILKKHSRTLEYVDLPRFYDRPVIPSTDDMDHEVPSMELLNHISILGNPDQLDSQLARLVVRCKNLKTLRLGCKAEGSPSDIWE